MDLMQIRRQMMGVIAQMASGGLDGWKSKTVTVSMACTNIAQIVNLLKAEVSTFGIAFAYKKMDYSVTPSINNEFISLAGNNNSYYVAIRFRSGNYSAMATLTATYDAVANIGDEIIILYQD